MKKKQYFVFKNIPFIIVFLVGLFLYSLPTESSASLIITEFMASNGSIAYDQSGKYKDWIEIHNTSSNPIDLGGYFISDELDDPLRWQIPERDHSVTIVPGGGYIVLIADGNPEEGPLHLNFELSKSGENITLTAPDGKTTLDVVIFGPQWKDISYGRSSTDPEQWFFHISPSPGRPNQGRATTSYWIAGLFLFYQSYRELFLAFFAFLAILIIISIRLSQVLKKLKKVEEKQTSLIQAVPEIILQIDHRGRVEWLNQPGINFFGEDAKGKTYQELFKNATYSTVINNITQNQQPSWDSKDHFTTEFSRENDRDQKTIIAWSSNPCFLKGKKTGNLLIGRDITEQNENEKRLIASERNYRDLFDKTPIGILKTNIQKDILDINQHMLDIFGCPSKKEILRNNLSYLFKNQQTSFFQNFSQLTYNQVLTGDQEFNSQWKEKFWLRYKIFPVFNEIGDLKEIIITGEDVTQIKEAEEKLQYISLHDTLTGLFNRTFFEEELKRLNTERQYPLSVIIGDVNGLKILNDTFGHSKGDELLRITANVLKKCCRKEDIISRWGGDEFGIILPQTDRGTALKICDRIHNECQIVEGLVLPLSIALGVSTIHISNQGQDFHQILSEAEENMYQEKLVESDHYRRRMLSSFGSNLKPKTWHSPYLTKICLWFGMVLNLLYSEEELTYLAELHDLGKINMDFNFLNQTTPLDEEGWKKIKKHPETGFRIAQAIPQISTIADAIWAHHERWDGTGYPRGLSGNDIPLLARIMAIADAFDAMISGRPYQPPRPTEEAVKELLRCAGSQFDPDLVQIFVKDCPLVRFQEVSSDEMFNF